MFASSTYRSLLNDLLQYHYDQDPSLLNSRFSYFFYKIVLHTQVRYFQAKKHSLSLSYWTNLFQGHFENLRSLNLSCSCNDMLLELIAQECPRLEILNATCRYERLCYSGNATTFSMGVTDVGLAHLSQCQALRLVKINEARSQRKGRKNTITHIGIRKMLRDIATLEDISYSDLGSVIAKDMNEVAELNLRVIRHYNASPASLLEIFRLCPRLRHLHLIFFSKQCAESIIDLLLENIPTTIQAIELQNLNFCYKFQPFLEQIGVRLHYLSIVSNFESISLDQMVLIGRHCPNLRHLCLSQLTNVPASMPFRRPSNFGQFSQLEYLDLSGKNLNLQPLLTFCTENAKDLRVLTLCEKEERCDDGDRIFRDWIRPANIRHVDISSNVVFSWNGVSQLIAGYPKLEFLSVNYEDDNQVVQNVVLMKLTLLKKQRSLSMMLNVV